MYKKIAHKIRMFFRDLFVNVIASATLTPYIIRYIIYKLFGIKTESYGISPRSFFGGNKVKIGKNTFINYDCFFDNGGAIEIGVNCNIGMGVTFITSNHEIGDRTRRAGKAIGKDIIIGDGVWIGGKVTILPAVSIGNGCIIGAGSVVTKDCEPNCIYAGNPAKKIRELDEPSKTI